MFIKRKLFSLECKPLLEHTRHCPITSQANASHSGEIRCLIVTFLNKFNIFEICIMYNVFNFTIVQFAYLF